jgi:hypothetical protein
MSTNIYILKLQGGKFYVGKSYNVMKRYQEHLSGSGSAWTKMYKPIALEKIVPNASVFDEDKYVKIYMAKYGMQNVRGGTYVSKILTREQEIILNNEIRAATDACTSCGRQGHFAKDCYAKTELIETSRPSSKKTPPTPRDTSTKYQFNQCYNCGEDGHLEYECSKVYSWECEHCSKTFETRYACETHEKCCSKKSVKNACYRCGRQGHYSPDCYARTHKDGYDLDSDED